MANRIVVVTPSNPSVVVRTILNVIELILIEITHFLGTRLVLRYA